MSQYARLSEVISEWNGLSKDKEGKMKKIDEVKDTAENLAVKIFEYIDATDVSDDEKDKLYLEIATSFMTCSVHETNHKEAINKIINNSKEIAAMGITGYCRFLDGNTDRIIKDLSQ